MDDGAILLSKFVNFIQHMAHNGPSVLQGSSSKLNSALQFPQMALSKFNILLKDLDHNNPNLLKQIYEFEESIRLDNSLGGLKKVALALVEVVFALNFFGLLPSEEESYKTSFVEWVLDAKNTAALHKLLRYIVMFNNLVDHSGCCKLQEIKQEVKEFEQKVVETVTKIKKPRKAAAKKVK
jgi:hypothetical protein